MTDPLLFEIPASLWMSANQRLHWAQRAKRTKALRQLGFVVARNARLGTLGTTHVAAFIGYPSGGRADPANASPTIKALIDGAVDAGVWPDDDHLHVIGPTYLRGPKSPPGTHTVRLVLTAQDVPWMPETQTKERT